VPPNGTASQKNCLFLLRIKKVARAKSKNVKAIFLLGGVYPAPSLLWCGALTCGRRGFACLRSGGSAGRFKGRPEAEQVRYGVKMPSRPRLVWEGAENL